MSTLTETLKLPAWLDGVTTVASVEYGRRNLSWTVGPGKLCANTFSWAHFVVAESEPWTGEGTRFWCTRRIGDGQRQPFTGRARHELSRTLLAAVNTYGFDRLWTEIHAATQDTDAAVREAESADRMVTWWKAVAALRDLHTGRMLDIVPIPVDHNTRQIRKRVLDRHATCVNTAPVVARVMCQGEHVGWVTDQAMLIPDDAILADTW